MALLGNRQSYLSRRMYVNRAWFGSGRQSAGDILECNRIAEDDEQIRPQSRALGLISWGAVRSLLPVPASCEVEVERLLMG